MWWLIIAIILVMILQNNIENYIPLTASEYQKYLTGYPNQTYEYALKSVAHPKKYFYDKRAPYLYGGYYQGMDFPTYW